MGETSPNENPWEQEWEVQPRPPMRSGGQGQVRRVSHRATGAEGALKTLRPETASRNERRFRLQREATALDMLGGQWAPRVLATNALDWRKTEVPLFIIAEWVPGPTLADLVTSRGTLDFAEALQVAIDLCRAVERCHNVNVYHRDIKPDNIILRDGAMDRPVLVDFGLSWLSAPQSGEDQFDTPAGEELGNRFLRLPEYAPDADQRDPRSDATMLAGILLYLITGRAPRVLRNERGQGPHDALQESIPGAIRQDYRWQSLLRIFRQAFQLNIDDRFPSVTALRKAFEAVLALPESPVAPSDALSRLRDVIARDPDRPRRERFRLMESTIRVLSDEAGRLCQGSPLVMGDYQRTILEADYGVELSFVIAVREPRTRLAIRHRIKFSAGAYTAQYRIGEDSWQTYYVGPDVDPESLQDAAREAGGAVVVCASQVLGRLLEDGFPRE